MNFDDFAMIIGNAFGYGNLDTLCDGTRSDENFPIAEVAWIMLSQLGLTREEIEQVGPWVRASEWSDKAATWVRKNNIRTTDQYLSKVETLLNAKRAGNNPGGTRH